tara:strand:+ start:272 stop:568 length:297 start_codon:yes stop_codon:yes gene_type:complete
MKMNARQVQETMKLLRNVAEVDDNDVIANGASQIAYELETVKLPFDTDTLNEKRMHLLRYAYSKRDQYILNPGARHAVDLQRVEKPRKTLKKRLTTAD